MGVHLWWPTPIMLGHGMALCGCHIPGTSEGCARQGTEPMASQEWQCEGLAGSKQICLRQLHPCTTAWWQCPRGTPALGSHPVCGYTHPDPVSTPHHSMLVRPQHQGPLWPQCIPAGIRYPLPAVPCWCSPANPFLIVPALCWTDLGCPGDGDVVCTPVAEHLWRAAIMCLFYGTKPWGTW